MDRSPAASLWKQNDPLTLNLYLTIHTNNLCSEVVDIAKKLSPSIDTVENAISILGVTTVQGIVRSAARMAARKAA